MATAPSNRKTTLNGVTLKATKPVYEPVLELPPLPADQYDALRQNVALNGVLVPILVDSDGPRRKIIDGNNRKQVGRLALPRQPVRLIGADGQPPSDRPSALLVEDLILILDHLLAPGDAVRKQGDRELGKVHLVLAEADDVRRLGVSGCGLHAFDLTQWWAIDAMPLAGTSRKQSLMRSSVKFCVWLGPPECYRNQDNVLWTPSETTSARNRADMAMRTSSIGRTYRNGRIAGAADERGGTTPFNLLPVAVGAQGSTGGHPAATPDDVAAWWCRYLLPEGGVLLDPFCGSGTMLQAALDHGASRAVGIEKEARYLEIARRRISGG
ncbi:DNA methyltransferase [Tautonia plasticadhaerens]|uniref:Methyltransferase n=1 Tax=Tautonia plasticadhaerens TaxID=2527974 RepID=A0A518H493_9BACT|nr:DNA methyltransferase [Tautonia plasticadhaerens]QDV35670.1 DNA methylase [Tautonia plasticadhaerens]